MAQMYIQQMTERHAVVLLEFQKELRKELAKKPPKWSRELLDQRRKQHINARNKNYAEAQKLKRICDKIEEKERNEMEQLQSVAFARREAKFRVQQQAELQALLKRIEMRRKEHIKQRNLDSKRLLQRNRNVQATLESKQNFETQKLFDNIKKTLWQTNSLVGSQMNTASGKGGKSLSGVNTRGSHFQSSAGSAGVAGGPGSNSQDRGFSASQGIDAQTNNMIEGVYKMQTYGEHDEGRDIPFDAPFLNAPAPANVAPN
jgi:hypothetical protein